MKSKPLDVELKILGTWGAVPGIRLNSTMLKNAGFEDKEKVRVEFYNGKIVISKI